MGERGGGDSLNIIPSFPVDLTWREKLAYLAVRFYDMGGPELPLFHSWKDGRYIREIHIPNGSLLIGSPHIHGHAVTLVSGLVSHIREQETTQREAPFSMMTAPNCQMVIYAHTDVVGRTFHRDSGERDPEKCRDEHFVPIAEDLSIGREIHAKLDKMAYEALLDEYGVRDKEEDLKKIYQDPRDIVDFPKEDKAVLGDSPIHGTGVMALEAISAGDFICNARIGSNRTPAGRYTNHSHDPNAVPIVSDGRITLMSKRSIRRHSEVTVDYRDMFNASRSLG